MSSDKFNTAFDALIGHEGGYVNNPKDPGGETKFGISKRSYPTEDIRGLTLARAKEIYERDFWRPVQGDFWPYPVAFNLFDGAVNSGPAQSIKWLQHAVGTLPDGKIGPATIAAAHAMASDRVAARYNGARLKFMSGLPTWPSFGKGWARRIAVNLLEGIKPMDYQSILLNVAVEQGLPIAVTVIGSALTAGAAWLGVRANKYLGVKIDAQLNTLFHAALTRLAEATVAEMAKGDARGGTAIGAKVVPGVAGRVAGQIMATMPGTLKKMGITDAASPVLIRLAQQAVERALAK